MRASRGLRPTGLDAVKRVGLRACVLAGLLVLHWGALPLLSAPNGVNVSGRTLGFVDANRTARPAIPVRDIVRAVAVEAERYEHSARAAPGPGSDQPVGLPAATVIGLAVAAATQRARLHADAPTQPHRRAFDARGPPDSLGVTAAA